MVRSRGKRYKKIGWGLVIAGTMAYVAFIRWGLLAAIGIGLLLVGFGYCVDFWDRRRDTRREPSENTPVRLSPAEELLIAPVRELQRLLPNLTTSPKDGEDQEK